MRDSKNRFCIFYFIRLSNVMCVHHHKNLYKYHFGMGKGIKMTLKLSLKQIRIFIQFRAAFCLWNDKFPILLSNALSKKAIKGCIYTTIFKTFLYIRIADNKCSGV